MSVDDQEAQGAQPYLIMSGTHEDGMERNIYPDGWYLLSYVHDSVATQTMIRA